jgi:cyclopropane-fatty-acyl-phospholipid synthase
VLTANTNDFVPPWRFDRIVSVEMFEHMSNWRPLLARAREALGTEGRFYIHIFSHRSTPYRFDHTDPADWIARHFFTGGIMPSHDLVREFGDLFAVEEEWRWNGRNYARTASAWLDNLDRHSDRVGEILRDVYGSDWRLWRRRWRLFFLATMGLFGHGDGSEWGVSHYRLAPA